MTSRVDCDLGWKFMNVPVEQDGLEFTESSLENVKSANALPFEGAEIRNEWKCYIIEKRLQT
jgi:hypothetical protein